MIISPHEYSGNLIACMKCFKRRDDPVHLLNSQALQTLRYVCRGCGRQSETEICESCSLTPATVFKTIELEHDRKQESEIVVTEAIRLSTQKACPGHVCSACASIWQHDYICNKPSGPLGLCKNCAGQAAAEINRPQHIEEIKVYSYDANILPGKEQSELRLQHYDFVVLNLAYFPSEKEPNKPDLSKPRPDALEKICEHILQLKKIQLQSRIKESSAEQVRREFEASETSKLTPEEQAQHKRDAKKIAAGKKPTKKPAETPEEQKAKAKKEWEKKLKELTGLVLSTNKKLSPEQARLTAEGMLVKPKE